MTVAAPMAQAQTPTPRTTATYERSAWKFWKAWDCLLGAAAFVVGNSVLVLRVRKAGGIVKFAKRLWKARDAEQRLKVIGSVIGYVTGSGVLVRACTP
ncbi:MAG: hypothetical protein M3N47_11230 [Chloroflexota bacterium]|nr:hypothetical protein [Chloroflexota bacterium]